MLALARSALVLVLGLTACNFSLGDAAVGSGTPTKETRAVTGFDSLEVSGAVDVTVAVGSPASLEVRADDNLLSHVKSEVRGSTLHLWSEGSHTTTIGLSATVAVPSLVGVRNDGSSDIVVTGVEGEQLTIANQGSGDLSLAGRVDALEIVINGSGDVDATALPATHARVTINGSSDVDVHAVESLHATINGSGDVRYRGNPKDVKRQVNGSGDIVAAEGGPS